MKYQFFTTDVFTNQVFGGAQIAVFPNAGGLSERQMQLLARELNLSETVFILPAQKQGSHCKVKIFTPLNEVDFGSHTVVATAFVLASIDKQIKATADARLVIELNIGEVEVYVDMATDGSEQIRQIQFSRSVAPQTDNYVPSDEEVAELLSLDVKDLATHKYKIMLSSSDITYLIVPASSLAALYNAKFDYKAWSATSAPATLAKEVLLYSTQTENSNSDFHARLLGPDIGIHDDPPVGGAVPAFVAYLCEHEHISLGTHTFVIERGKSSTRQSLLSVEMDHEGRGNIQTRVGGSAVMVSSGEIEVPQL